MLRILGLVLCLTIAACAPKEDLKIVSEPDSTEDAIIVLTEADNDKDWVFGVGDTFKVKLESIPTAGYLWNLSHLPEELEQVGEFSMEATDPELQSQPGYTGGNHYIVYTFKTIAEGDVDLVLVEGRPWEILEEDGNLKSDWKSMSEGQFQIRLRIRQ